MKKNYCYQIILFILFFITLPVVAKRKSSLRAPRQDATEMQRASVDPEDVQKCIGVLEAGHGTLYEKLEDLDMQLSRHDMVVDEVHERICSKLEDLDEEVLNGFDELQSHIEEVQDVICSKIERIEQRLGCDFVITQEDIDGGFTTPFADTVYCLAESVTFTGAAGIIIDKNNVTLKLQGNLIEGSAIGSDCILVQGATNVTIKNGMLRNPNGADNMGSHGISINNSDFVRVFDIDCVETFASAVKVNSSSDLLLQNVRSYKANTAGSTLTIDDQGAFSINGSRNFDIKRCSAVKTSSIGFNIRNSSQGLLLDCVSQETATGFSLSLNGNYVTFKKCLAQNTDGIGYDIDDTQNTELIGCTAQYSNTDSFLINNALNILLKQCSVFDSGSRAFAVQGSSNRIEINACKAANEETGLYGFYVDGGESIGINYCVASNYQFGMQVTNSLNIGIEESAIQSCFFGIFINYVENLLIKKCNILGGNPFSNTGIDVSGPNNNVMIVDNNILNAGAQGMVTVGGVNLLIMENNITGHSASGIYNTILLSAATFYANHSILNVTNYATGITTPPNNIVGNCYWINE